MKDHFETILRDEENQIDSIVVEGAEQKVLFCLRQKRRGKWRSLKTTLTFTQARVLGDTLLYLGKNK